MTKTLECLAGFVGIRIAAHLGRLKLRLDLQHELLLGLECWTFGALLP
jgi:hypothetical protein